MNSKIYCVTSIENVGCTFLDWSILWLSGQHRVFSIAADQWVEISADPLQSGAYRNAHGHQKNHTDGFAANQIYIDKLKLLDSTDLRSIYPFALTIDQCCRDLAIDCKDLQQDHIHQRVIDYQQQDYRNLLEWLTVEQQTPCVFVAFDPAVTGYRWQLRSADRMQYSSGRPRSEQDIHDEFENIFYPTTRQAWQQLGLDSVWDQRERWALDMRPFSATRYDRITFAFPHLWINCQDLWFDTARTLQMIMQWLGISVDPRRYQQWLPVMHHWQTFHNDALKFYRMVPHIVDSTVNGHYFDLPQLTLWQEAVIQHCLIYQHGLNLKTWQLSQFPGNTKDLHLLLEPNIHPL